MEEAVKDARGRAVVRAQQRGRVRLNLRVDGDKGELLGAAVKCADQAQLLPAEALVAVRVVDQRAHRRQARAQALDSSKLF